MSSPAGGVPVFTGAYVALVNDVPGTVAANNFLVAFNPTASPITMQALTTSVSSYTTGASSTPDSLLIQRISSVSGGTQVTPSSITKFATFQPNPRVQIFTGNPTVTLVGVPIRAFAPPITVGTGGGGTGTQGAPAAALFLPGQGAVWYTTAGNINQMWNIDFVWGEF